VSSAIKSICFIACLEVLTRNSKKLTDQLSKKGAQKDESHHFSSHPEPDDKDSDCAMAEPENDMGIEQHKKTEKTGQHTLPYITTSRHVE
jgi:hypothetical protein